MADDTMRVDVFMPLYVRDFIAATLGWTAEEKGHYMTLLMVQWDRGGLPADLAKLERISPGVGNVWELIEEKFPESSDGQRRNERLESHRTKCVELKRKRQKASEKANQRRWENGACDPPAIRFGSQTDAKRIPNGSDSDPKRIPSNSNTNSNSIINTNGISKEENTHTQAGKDFPERGGGWAAEAWEQFAHRWNRTERARPWTAFTPPDGWVDYASRPGWIEKASDAMGRLPGCEFFEQPLAVTKFLDFVDRILAGEFDHAKSNGRQRRKTAGVRL